MFPRGLQRRIFSKIYDNLRILSKFAAAYHYSAPING